MGSICSVPETSRRPPAGMGEVSSTVAGVRDGHTKSRIVSRAPATSMRAGGVTAASTMVAACSSNTASRSVNSRGEPAGATGADAIEGSDGGADADGADGAGRGPPAPARSRSVRRRKRPSGSRWMRAHDRRVRTRSTTMRSGQTASIPVTRRRFVVSTDRSPSEMSRARRPASPLILSRGVGLRGPDTARFADSRPPTWARKPR